MHVPCIPGYWLSDERLRVWPSGQAAGRNGVEPETAHLQVQAAAGESEDSRGFRNVAGGPFERRGNELALDPFDRLGEIPRQDTAGCLEEWRGALVGPGCQVGGEVIRVDDLPGRAHRDGPLNLVAQLPDVPRPPIAGKQIEGCRTQMHVGF